MAQVVTNVPGCGNKAKEAIEFDQSKAGVKGLIDAGVDKIPSIFVLPPESRPDPAKDAPGEQLRLPVISLGGLEGTRRPEIVEGIREAARSWGFFQIVNHGVPLSTMKGLIESIRRFHEQPSEEKEEFYTRCPSKSVRYYCTSGLHSKLTAHWRDTLAIDYEEGKLDPQLLPPACREAMVEYVSYILKLRNTLTELLSEALGLPSDFLSKLEGMETPKFVCHYYPPCPQPELTLGLTRHADPCFLTILLQDSVGGLQVLHDSHWVNVTPMEGAFVINIGDFLQMVTNDKFVSVEHRVLAGSEVPRLSVGCLLYPSKKNNNKVYAPIKEVLSEGEAPIYREFKPTEYYEEYDNIGLNGNRSLPRFMI